MRYLLAIALTAFISFPVLAAEKPLKNDEPLGGFEGPVSGADAQTTDKALTLSPDSRVLLKGHLDSRLVGEKNIYLFKDDTGQIEVHITPRQFGGNTIKPDTLIQISGKIEKPANPGDKPRIRVRELEILK